MSRAVSRRFDEDNLCKASFEKTLNAPAGQTLTHAGSARCPEHKSHL